MLGPTFDRLAQGQTVFRNDQTQTALAQAAQDREIGVAGLSRAAAEITNLYGQMNSSLTPAGEISSRTFRSEEMAEQIRARSGSPLATAAIRHLADTILQPQRVVSPAEMAAAAAAVNLHEGVAEAQVAAQLGASRWLW